MSPAWRQNRTPRKNGSTSSRPWPAPSPLSCSSSRSCSGSSPSTDNPLVKRVIAVSGDTIDLRDGSVYLNGELLDEPYIDQETYDVSPGPPDFPLTVPRGYVFVMGDNRGNSLDSRSYEVGLVDTHRILGKVMVHLSNSEE